MKLDEINGQLCVVLEGSDDIGAMHDALMRYYNIISPKNYEPCNGMAEVIDRLNEEFFK